MAKADRIKEELGWLKVVFTLCVTLDAALVVWLAQNYAAANTVLVFAGLMTALALGAVIVFVNRYAYRRIVELEDA